MGASQSQLFVFLKIQMTHHSTHPRYCGAPAQDRLHHCCFTLFYQIFEVARAEAARCACALFNANLVSHHDGITIRTPRHHVGCCRCPPPWRRAQPPDGRRGGLGAAKAAEQWHTPARTSPKRLPPAGETGAGAAAPARVLLWARASVRRRRYPLACAAARWPVPRWE